MTLSTFKEWPRWVHNPVSNEWRVFPSLAAIPADWIAAIEAPPHHPLDHDGDGRKGGAVPAAKRARKAKA